jgi:Rrf2 family cysteine metabolism transcriptional repressor
MKLSTRARYALRMMVAIARYTNGNGLQKTVSLKDIAERTNISRRYLEQLVISLKNASLVRAKAGRGGGYSLVKPPAAIDVGEIVEAAIGQINIVDCVLEPGACDKSGDCGCRSIYCDINERITDTLNEITLQSLLDRESANQPAAN